MPPALPERRSRFPTCTKRIRDHRKNHTLSSSPPPGNRKEVGGWFFYEGYLYREQTNVISPRGQATDYGEGRMGIEPQNWDELRECHYVDSSWRTCMSAWLFAEVVTDALLCLFG